MKRAASALLIACFLAAVGLAIFIHKLVVLDIPFLPAQAYNTWAVEARVTLKDQADLLNELLVDQADAQTPAPKEIRFYLPQTSEQYKLIDEGFEGKGFDPQIMPSEDSSNRVAVLKIDSATSSGVLFYRATIQSESSRSAGVAQLPTTLGKQVVDQQVEQIKRSAANKKESSKENFPTDSIDSLIQEARQSSNGDFAFVRRLYLLALDTGDNRVRTIREALQLGNSTAEVAAVVLNESDIAARVGNGILLNAEEAYDSRFSQWLEVNVDQQWFTYDVVSDRFGTQDRYLKWWYGTGGVISADDASIEVTVRPDTTDGLSQSARANGEGRFFFRHSFVSLPLSTQRVIQVLVMIPLGALIVAVLHQMVGLQTFGTFTPVLIALSFRETGLLLGLGLFIAIVSIGAIVRSGLNQVQLLVVPRLAAVLTVTVLVIGIVAIALNNYGLRYGLSISLFPIVILAMTIERAAVMWEEEGAKETAIATAGSLIVAVLGYLCISNPYAQHWAFVFPELLLVVLAVTVLLGRYNGYKLTEYFRFLALQKQIQQSGNS
ncbi:MAG: UUP1 family membrane protein [Phormidesmis sp.]